MKDLDHLNGIGGWNHITYSNDNNNYTDLIHPKDCNKSNDINDFKNNDNWKDNGDSNDRNHSKILEDPNDLEDLCD